MHIVREALTELIPHDKENREWKGPQLAELLHTIGIQDICIYTNGKLQGTGYSIMMNVSGMYFGLQIVASGNHIVI